MNRRRHLWTAVVCLPLACVLPWFFPNDLDPTNQFLSGLLLGVPSGLAGGSIALLMRKAYLTYDVQTRTLRGPSRWRNLTSYPRRGYDRLEFSPYDARIYEVRTDGKRRRLMFRRWVADQGDWRALVDLLLTQQNARATSAPAGRFKHDHKPSTTGDPA